MYQLYHPQVMGRQYKEDDPSTSSNLLKRDVIFWRREETLQPKSTTAAAAAQCWPEALTKCRPKTDHELADDTRHTSTTTTVTVTVTDCFHENNTDTSHGTR